MSGTIQAFLLILCVSFVFTTLLSRVPLLRIPSAVGYLMFGVLLHTGAIHLSEEELRWLTELGDVGLLFLMFLSGMEVDVSQLRPQAWRKANVNPLYLASSIFMMTLLTSYGLSLVLVHFVPGHASPWMITLLFATTSLGIIVPILEEADVLHSEFGQVLLLSALLADLCTMLLISLFISARTSGQTTDFLLALTVIPLAVIVFVIVAWSRKSPYIRSFAGDLQNRMRAIVALVAAFCAVADFTGSEPIIGSFLVGIMVAAIPFAHKRKLRDYCHGVGYGFLIPVFFISVGLNFDYQIFKQPSSWIWVPMLLIVAFAVKMIPAIQLRRYFGTKASVAGGILLSARLSLIVAAADVGVRIGALPEFLSESIVIVAVCTCLLAPIAFVALM
jgi:Kef-type K+ transport system membrane component KefB